MAFYESTLDKIEVKEPFANEKARTPSIMTIVQYTLSTIVVPEISPYPTVVMVVTVQ